MSRKTEQEFMEEGFSAEELTALNGTGDTSGSDATVAVDAPQEAEPAPVVTTEAAPVETPPAVETEPKMVDIRAVQEVRAEKRAAEQENARLKIEQAKLEERIKLINEAMAAQNKPAAAAVPTEEEDPFGYIQHELKATKAELQAIKDAREQETKLQAEARQYQAVIDRADMTLAQARTKHTDLDDALNFATESVKKEVARRVTAQGLTGEQFVQAANQMFQNTLATYARDCPADPDEAAEHIRRHARYWGWTGPQQAQAAQQASIVQPQAQQPVVQQPTIQERAEAQDRHMSLSGIQGGAAPAKLDAKALMAMSDDQYKELLKTVAGRKQLEEQFGGV